MKLSRDWMSDYIDLSGLSDEELATRFTEIGHAVESMERHGDDTVFDLEITTNRVDAMSHLGMARELAAALGREVRTSTLIPGRVDGEGPPVFSGRAVEGEGSFAALRPSGPPPAQDDSVKIRIDAPDMCSRYTGVPIRGITIGESPQWLRTRLEAVGLRPINNAVDVTNYVMLALGHPLHAFDLDKLHEKTIIVRRGAKGEKMKSLDGQMRDIDTDTVVIADARRAVALGGIIGGEESEIGPATRNVLLECAWFNPSIIRRTARRLGIKTDASYRFERRVDPNDTLTAAKLAASLITQLAGGTEEQPIDVVAQQHAPATLRLRSQRLRAASAGAVGDGYALDLFRRLGFSAKTVSDGIEVVVPTYRGDIFEEIDLVEEVLRFFGLNNVPAELPRLTTGDVHENPVHDAEDNVRQILAGCGLAEIVTYSFIAPEQNALFSSEQPILITNALSENVSAMRLSMLPGLLDTVAFNRSYGTRDGALFEVGRTYHRSGRRERSRAAIVMFGSIGAHWGDAKRAVDFFDAKGIVEQIAAREHVMLEWSAGDDEWLKKGSRAVARAGQRHIATAGFLSTDVLHKFGIKGDVAAAELDIEELLASKSEWKMAPVARFPGVPMILALTHGRDLEYEKIARTIRSLDVPYLHEVGLRDRFVPEGTDSIKTTLGMWYQAFDRSLTQEEVGESHQKLAARVAELLPVIILS